MKKNYKVTGMSCAACSARVQKAVSNVNGVAECNVNLLTGDMTVDGQFDGSSVIAAVKKAGYGVHLQGNVAADETDVFDVEVKKIKNEVYIVVSLPHNAYVRFDGYDVGISVAESAKQKSCGQWAYSVAAERNNISNKSKIFYKRIQSVNKAFA